ncbi:MAG TPA: hypothetical protein PLK37_01510 [Terricaulis sp.]|nr:hypothetical protein [Terricaulis sp.]
MKRFALAALALTLAACGPRAEKAAEAPPAEAAAAAQAASIGPGGAAGISAALAMSVEAIQAAAPSYQVASTQDQIEGQPFTAITLSSGAAEIFRVLPTADGAYIHAIVTRSPQARGPTQDIVGQTLFGVAPPEQVPFCLAEQVDGQAGFACSTGAGGNFWRVYKLPDAYDGPAGAFEEIEPDVLHDATLVEMRWIAPRA